MATNSGNNGAGRSHRDNENKERQSQQKNGSLSSELVVDPDQVREIGAMKQQLRAAQMLQQQQQRAQNSGAQQSSQQTSQAAQPMETPKLHGQTLNPSSTAPVPTGTSGASSLGFRQNRQNPTDTASDMRVIDAHPSAVPGPQRAAGSENPSQPWQVPADRAMAGGLPGEAMSPSQQAVEAQEVNGRVAMGAAAGDRGGVPGASADSRTIPICCGTRSKSCVPSCFPAPSDLALWFHI